MNGKSDAAANSLRARTKSVQDFPAGARAAPAGSLLGSGCEP
jgi:hypothetical protein